MSRASALTGRLRRRARREGVSGPVPPRLPGLAFSPEGARRLDEATARADARMAAEIFAEPDECSVTDAIAGHPEREFPSPAGKTPLGTVWEAFEKESGLPPEAAERIAALRAADREFPYLGGASPDQAVAVMLSGADAEEALLAPRPQPSFTPAAELRKTAPIAALPAPVTAGGVIGQALQALRDLDFAVLDDAREQHVTYAARVRGRAPLGDALESAWRPAVRPERRHAEAARRRTESLAYPPCDITAPDHAVAYIALMRQLDRITGTQGRNWWTLPALPAGSAS